MRRQRLNISPALPEGRQHVPAGFGLSIEFCQLTDVGRIRDHNEDALGTVIPQGSDSERRRGWLFVLADGVGGHERGEVASQAAVDCLVQGFADCKETDVASEILQRLIQKANLQIYELGASSGPGGKSMATTIVACVLRYDRLTVAHVGDSRCYIVRDGRARAITRDHTVSQEQLRMGLITARDAASAEHTNVLSRSVGSDIFINVDVAEEQIFPDDVVVLCSDGLHNSVKDGDLERTLRKKPPLNEAAVSLVSLARERDGTDNISVQLIHVKGVERVGLYRGRHYRLR